MEILDAAFDAFAAEGFAGTRLDDIAARAGVTKGTIYVYFDSKEELFVAALKQMVSPTLDHLRNLMAAPRGSAADILREHLLFVADHMLGDRRKREILRILIADGPRFPVLLDRWHADVVVPCCEGFSAVVAYGVQRGEFARSSGAELPQVILAPVITATVWLSMFGDRHPLDLKRFFAAAVDTLVHGLAVRPDAQP